jgi:hypothetical protein
MPGTCQAPTVCIENHIRMPRTSMHHSSPPPHLLSSLKLPLQRPHQTYDINRQAAGGAGAGAGVGAGAGAGGCRAEVVVLVLND